MLCVRMSWLNWFIGYERKYIIPVDEYAQMLTEKVPEIDGWRGNTAQLCLF